MGKEKWNSMSDKEKNELLGMIGGCLGCCYWRRMPPLERDREGCIEPTQTAKQIHDNGCVDHSRLNADFYE